MKRAKLWAPWRIKYIQGLCENNGGCFVCEHRDEPQKDRENLVLWRTKLCIVLFNKYPYNNGHLLIAPLRHIPDFESATDEEMFEMILLVRQTQRALKEAVEPHGFNIGANFGRCAGAGLPGHLHIHVVPRWDGDTSFMAVCSDTDVISQSLTELWEQLQQISKERNLQNL